MHKLRIVSLVLCLSLSFGAYAQKQSRADAQALGDSVGAALLSSGPLTPAASARLSAPGASNIFGSAYTGDSDTAQTGQVGSASMIGIANKARAAAADTFKGYTAVREDQASQATTFLDKTPILKPTLLSSDPMFRTTNMTATDIFSSNSNTVCKQKTVTNIVSNAETFSCIQSYNPYVITCSSSTTIELAGTEIICRDTSFLCTPGSASCCNISIKCGEGNSAILSYNDCCGATTTVTTSVSDINQIRTGVIFNAGGANLTCKSDGTCFENFVDYYCDDPATPIGYYPSANSFTLGIKSLFRTVQANNCSTLEGLATP